jgi:uridine kinase
MTATSASIPWLSGISHDALGARIQTARLIAIDGLPCSGKSALADRLAAAFGLETLAFDDFYLPEPLWPRGIRPGFPFPFFRVKEFHEALHGLATEGRCSYRPYDWCNGQISSIARELYRRGPLIVEGCSVLDPQLEPHYDLRLFVASDRETVLAARRARDGDHDAENWQRLFLPSVDLYMATLPERRADFVISGRG